jgi:hypothetical protein
VDILTSTASKIFADCYALFSGRVLVGAAGLVLDQFFIAFCTDCIRMISMISNKKAQLAHE